MAILSGNRLSPIRLNTRAVRARRTTTQSLATGAVTSITYDSEDFDNASMFTTPSTAIVLPVAGLWGYAGSAAFTSNATGYRRLLVDINGSGSYPTIDARTAVSGDHTAITLSGTHVALAGDVLRMYAQQNSGGALNLLAGAYFSAWLIES